METQELKDALKLWTWLYCANVFKPCSALLIFIGVSFILLGFTSDKSGSKVHWYLEERTSCKTLILAGIYGVPVRKIQRCILNNYANFAVHGACSGRTSFPQLLVLWNWYENENNLYSDFAGCISSLVKQINRIELVSLEVVNDGWGNTETEGIDLKPYAWSQTGRTYALCSTFVNFVYNLGCNYQVMYYFNWIKCV